MRDDEYQIKKPRQRVIITNEYIIFLSLINFSSILNYSQMCSLNTFNSVKESFSDNFHAQMLQTFRLDKFGDFNERPLCIEPSIVVAPPSSPWTAYPFERRYVEPIAEKNVHNIMIETDEFKLPKIVVPQGEYSNGRWTRQEIESFLQGFKMYGKQWANISRDWVPTRSPTQVTSYGCRKIQKGKLK